MHADGVSKALASEYGMDTINLEDYVVPEDVLSIVPRHTARRYKIVPVYKHDGTLTVAISDPLDVDTVDFDQLGSEFRTTIEMIAASGIDD